MTTNSRTTIIRSGLLFIVALALAACASAPPQELVEARQSYEMALAGEASQFAPAKLKTAEEKLKKAEATFEDEGDEPETRDYAYIADRAAKLAMVEADLYKANERVAQLDEALLEGNQLARRQATKDLRSERQARMQAEQQLQSALDRLSAVAQVDRNDPRGLVITIAGSLLFRFDESQLTAAAQAKLNDVAQALLAAREGQIVVEGHTDSQGSSSYNEDLSRQRAESVRQYLISQGVAPDRIVAVGKGENDPIASNDSPEGRANNRRVEIIVPNGGETTLR